MDPMEGGSCTLLETFGDALTVVNAARLSFDTQHTALDTQDRKLLRFLWKHQHTSPFRHVMLRFQIVWPEFVARQAYKHCVGIEATSGTMPTKDTAWSEVSRRYRPVVQYWEPTTFRKQSATAKQGSDGVCDEETQTKAMQAYQTAHSACKEAYQTLLELGVAREQARAVLPISQMTTVCWTMSLQAAMHFIALRSKPDAQPEIAVYAEAMERQIWARFPELAKAMQE